MRLYNKSHKHYCGIDLHTKKMYVCILDNKGEILLHKNIPTKSNAFLKLIEPYREDLVVGVECIFSWYWLADLCAEEKIDFILGHALYMKAIHGGKAKNDKIDSEKIARLMRGANFPLAYVYPKEIRAIRDLMRRRNYLVRVRAESIAHIQLTNYQYNLPALGTISKKHQRVDLLNQFDDSYVRKNVEIDLQLIEQLDQQIAQLENFIIRHARGFDTRSYHRLQTVPGIGRVLALVILYEVGDINRFESVKSFASYCRLVKSSKESAGKIYGTQGNKIGNPHLKWAFSEAAMLLLRDSDRAKAYVDKMTKKHTKGKALALLTHKLGRAVYYVWTRKDAFDEKYFFQQLKV